MPLQVSQNSTDSYSMNVQTVLLQFFFFKAAKYFAPSCSLNVLRCLSCVKQAIFLQLCLFDSDDIMLERVSGWGNFPHSHFYTPI